MYPSRPSRKALLIMLGFSVLVSAFLVFGKSGIHSAAANSPLGKIEINNVNGSLGSLYKAADLAAVDSSSVDVRVSAKFDDAEQRLDDGHVYLTRNDLQLVADRGINKGLEVVGLRFNGLNIPRGVTIVQAYLEFHVNESTSDATTLVFHGEASDNAAMFANQAYDISNRAKTNAAVNWDNVPAWNTVGATVQTPDLSGVIQEIVNRPGWGSGNSLAIIVDGSGRRVISAFETGAQTAALLHVAYLPVGATASPTSLPASATPTSLPATATRTPTAPPPSPTNTPITTVNPPTPTPTPASTVQVPSPTKTPISTAASSALDIRVATGNDDVEQRVTDGNMYMNSSDLELTNDPGVALANQTVGMRFNRVLIPKGSTILQAYIEFQVDETSSETTSLTFRAESADNSAAFSTASYNVSSRAKTIAAVSWNNIPTWNTVGAKIQSPNLAPIIQEVVNRQGWVEGNSLSIIVDGSGRRVATAYEYGVQSAPLLHIIYLPMIVTVTATPNPPGVTPTPTRTPTATPMPTTPPTPDPSPTPVGQTGAWHMIFSDEFNGTALDSSKWRKCFWWADVTCTIETNHELELYNPDDVLVQNGLLRMRAQRRDMVAWNGVTYHYTSGMVMTGGRSGQINPGFSFTYGYAEARVWVPAGKGLWPAFWMLPVSYNSRPEIDIMEILGDTTNQYHMNYHYMGGDAGSTWIGPDFSAGWHVLGLDWTPTALVWYVDGVERWRYTSAAHISNEPEYLLLNLAVGGDWPGAPDANTPFPSYFDVDYVRVWQR